MVDRLDDMRPGVARLDDTRQPAPAALVLHDVAPATLDRCQALLRALAPLIRPLGPMPVTHLVVPHYHGGTTVAEDGRFRQWLDTRLAMGDEVVLHGYRHLDEQPLRGPVDRITRRFYTLEGEFATLTHGQADRALASGMALMRSCDWQPRGFVAPAWLMSDPVRAALPAFDFDWTATRTGLVNLRSGRERPATSLVWSVRAGWRRWMSAHYNGWLLDRLLSEGRQDVPIRLGLHPVDADWPEAVGFWREALERVLSRRPAATKSVMVGQESLGGEPQAS